MNPSFCTRFVRRGFCVGALLGAITASAQTTVTFQVDMSNNPLTAGQTVVASGTFDGWANLGSVLTNNPNADNPNLYTGTYVDSSDANGKAMDWQYRIVSGGNVVSYSGQADSDNYIVDLPSTGGSLVLPVQFWSDDGAPVANAITFQVDMAEQLHLGNFNTGDDVYCQGSFEGWNDSFQLTNDPALNVTNGQGIVSSLPYIGTYTTWSASPGAAAQYKFVYNDGVSDHYEAPTTGDPDNGQNRGLLNVAQTLPLVNYSDTPFSATVTNVVTFQIDMTTQIQAGSFTNGSSVEIHGDYNSWGSGTTMTNDPAASNPNIYSTQITYMDGQGAEHFFKYVMQPGTQWENVSAANASGGNRYFFLQSTGDIVDGAVYLTNGPVYFSDEPPSALIDFVTVTNCMVTFTVQMTNAVGTDGTPFDNAYPSGQTIYINGLQNGINNSFATWAQPPFPGNGGIAMTQIPNTTLFTATVPIARGQNDELIYKYSINGFDNEAGMYDNHERWIRSLPNYTMPVDTFGSQGNTTQVEIPAGNLKIASTNASSVQVSWLGRRGVQLQTATSLTGVWTAQPLTDGTNLIVAPGGTATTNFAIGSGSLFYRLVGPQ